MPVCNDRFFASNLGGTYFFAVRAIGCGDAVNVGHWLSDWYEAAILAAYDDMLPNTETDGRTQRAEEVMRAICHLLPPESVSHCLPPDLQASDRQPEEDASSSESTTY